MLSNLDNLQYKVMFRMVNSYLYEYPILPQLYEEHRERTIYEREANNHRRRKKVNETREFDGALIIYGNGKEEVCAITCDDECVSSNEAPFTIHLTHKWGWWISRKEREEAADEVIHTVGLDDTFTKIEELCDTKYRKCEYRSGKKRLEAKIEKLEADISEYKNRIKKAKKALGGGDWLYD